MSKKYNQTFKSEAVKKMLSRGKDTTMEDISVTLGVAKFVSLG
ncbi:MAG: hypothetical protein ACI8VC_000202 [Candidatus Endobugula sp.]|jgi:hypothetical protein